jgi:aminoglycoside phosphotransferase
MLKLLLSPSTWVGAGIAFGLTLSWAVFLHGPAQYRAGGLKKAAELDAATNRAIKELSDEADRARFLRRQCIELGRVYEFATGRCVERAAE